MNKPNENWPAGQRHADDVGDWKERLILEPLAQVADYVKRIGDHCDSAHYRADKTGSLLSSARQVQLEAILAFAGWPDEDSPPARLLETADRLLGEVTAALRSIMWSAASSERGAPAHSDAAELADVARRVQSWAAGLAATSVPRRENSSTGPSRGPGPSR